MAGWRAAVGLEIHAQISSICKIFSRGSTAKLSQSNSGIHFFDIGVPGSLPVLNKSCVEAALKSAVALSATVNRVSYFDRKHYFYPDLPNGYQITQKRRPIAEGGHLVVSLLKQYSNGSPAVPRPLDGGLLRVDLQRIQLEHDSGKTTYESYEDGSSATIVDYSRSGCGLMEIVTEPVLCNGAEAASFVKELQLLLRTINTCDGNMEDGSLRVDANVSVAPAGSQGLGTRSEVKNISGLRFLARAIDYEIARHVDLLEGGKEVEEETRFFNERKGTTIPSRSKAPVHDYRFLPEPDLPPLVLSESEAVDEFTVSIPLATKGLPLLPMQTREKLVAKYDLKMVQASLLLDRQAVHFYEGTCERLENVAGSHQEVFKWLTHDVFSLCQTKGTKNAAYEEVSPISPEQLASVVDLFLSQQITRAGGQKMLKWMADGERELAYKIAEKSNLLVQPLDGDTLKEACLQVVLQHPKEVKQFQDGKDSKIGFLIASVIKATDGKAKPQEVRSELVNIIYSDQTPSE